MRAALAAIIQDPSYNDEYLNQYLNYAYALAAGMVQIPGLKSIGSLTTVVDTYTLDLSLLTGGFGGKLTYIGRSAANAKAITIYATLEDFVAAYPTLDETGAVVEAVVNEGSTLWYQPYPTAAADVDTLNVVYYRNPPTLSDDTDVPSYIPAHIHSELIVLGAAWTIFDQIEDGIDGEKINAKAMYWRSFAEDNSQSGIKLLKRHIATVRPHFIASTWAN
jgi:hypothetical protein